MVSLTGFLVSKVTKNMFFDIYTVIAPDDANTLIEDIAAFGFLTFFLRCANPVEIDNVSRSRRSVFFILFHF